MPALCSILTMRHQNQHHSALYQNYQRSPFGISRHLCLPHVSEQAPVLMCVRATTFWFQRSSTPPWYMDHRAHTEMHRVPKLTFPWAKHIPRDLPVF